MIKKMDVQIVTYNSEKYISNCLMSLMKQTYKNFRVEIIDNNSSDETINSIYRICSNFCNNEIVIKRNKDNTGFCAAHNQGFNETHGDYVLVLNPDVILDEYFIENAINVMKTNPNIGALTGKILRMKGDFTKTNIIDSTGVNINKQRRAYDRGQGEIDSGQYDNSFDVFGVSGAAAVYRREMLEDIKVLGECFDETFFAYKEDVDLSWRARLRGWECKYYPEIVAYHMRGWNEGNRKSQPLFIRVHSIKNRILMMIKNESLKIVLMHSPHIILFEVLVFWYCLFFDFKALKYILDVFKLLPLALKKRKIIQKGKKIKDKEIYRYF